MSNDLEKTFVFQHRTNKAIMGVVGILCLITIVLAVLKGNDWIFAAVFSAIGFCLYVALANVKLEISPDGFSYRDLNFKGSRTVNFGEIEKAYFEEDRRGEIPVAAFWVQLRDVRRLRVPLRLFPMRASALLFAQLDRHEIPIAEPDTVTTQRASEQIRNAQVKIFGGWTRRTGA